MIKLKVPDGVSAVSHAGQEYTLDADDCISVETCNVKALTDHGFSVFVEELTPKQAKAKAAADAA